MSILKNAAARLETAKAERGKTEMELAGLRAQRDACDVEAADYLAVYETLDARVAVKEKSLCVIAAQIERLAVKAEAETRAAAAVRRAAAIAAVEKMLPERLAIVAEIEAAVSSLPRLFAKLDKDRAKFNAMYPQGLERPYEFYLSNERVLNNVLSALRAIRGEDIADAIEGLAAGEQRQHEELIADLKQNPAPEIERAA